MGDSEASGSGSLPGLPDFYPPLDGTLFMCDELNPAVVAYDESSGVDPFGMFGWYRQRQTGRNTIIVNMAVSGSNSTLYARDANPASTYQHMLVRLATALAVPGARIAGVCLYGGANDATLNNPWLTNWTSNKAQIITDVAAIPGGSAISTCRWLVAQLPNGVPHVNYQLAWSTGATTGLGVRGDQAQWAVNDASITLIPVATTGPWVSSPQNNTNFNYLVHAETFACRQIGDDFAVAMGGAIPALTIYDIETFPSLYAYYKTMTNSGGFVDAYTDAVRSRTLPGTLTARPAYTAADAAWNNVSTGTWDGSNDQLLGTTASDWAFLPTGSTSFIPFIYTTANADLFSTRSASTNAGVLVRCEGGFIKLYDYAAGQSGGSPYATIISVPLATNTKAILVLRMQAGNVQMRLNCSGATASSRWVSAASYTGGPPSGNPEYGLNLGYQFYRYAGKIVRPAFFNTFMTSESAINQVAQTLARELGLV